MKKWLVGQGAVAIDTLFYCDAPLPKDGFTRAHKEIVLSGGSGANLLTAAAWLGCPAKLVAKIGDDAWGRRIRVDLLADGISDQFLFTCPGGVSLHTYIVVGPEGDRSIIVNPGDCYDTLIPADLPEEILKDAFLFYTDGSPREAAVALARQAKELGIPVFYQKECPDRDAGDPVMRRLREELESLADLISAGIDVYEQWVGTRTPGRALELAYQRCPCKSGVVMTAGSKGAFWYDGTRLLKQPCFPIHPMDSTGAGDAFCGGLSYAYYYCGWEKPQALAFAAACGAMQCCQTGPRLRTNQAEVMDFIQTHPIPPRKGGGDA